MSGGTPDFAVARAAKAALTDRLAGDDRVVGIGIGRDGAGYVVEVRLAEESARSAVPETVDDVGVRTRVVGRVTPY